MFESFDFFAIQNYDVFGVRILWVFFGRHMPMLENAIHLGKIYVLCYSGNFFDSTVVFLIVLIAIS